MAATESTWVRCSDGRGRVFFSDVINQVTVWELPGTAQSLPTGDGIWWDLYDDATGFIFYYNTANKTRTWLRPATYTSMHTVRRPGQPAGEVIGVKVINMNSASSGLPDGWRAILDPASQKYFYQNTADNTVQWDRPPGSAPLPTPHPVPTRKTTTTRTDSLSAASTSSAAAASSPKADRRGRAASSAVSGNGKAEETTDFVPPAALPPSLAAEIVKFQMKDYAAEHFAVRKRGVFRRKVPLDELMIFSPNPLNNPLLDLPKAVCKEAAQVFKLIQTYMGDLKATRSDPTQAAVKILQAGMNTPELRDEIYCQLVKQTTNNPDTDSRFRGWELFCCCVATFPCTKGIEAYLMSYFQRNYDSQESSSETKEFAAHCLRRLTRINASGAPHRTPDAAWVQRNIDAPFNPRLFGSSIQEIMIKERRVNPELTVPRALPVLVDAIFSLGGTSQVGIFRVPGEAESVQALKDALEREEFSVPGTDPNLPSGVLKLWMRELEEPIVPPDLYNRCLKCRNKADLDAVLADMPPVNRCVIAFIVDFLRKMVDPKFTAVTKMDIANVSMVFAPNFVRNPSSDPGVIFDMCKSEQEFVRLLIENGVDPVPY